MYVARDKDGLLFIYRHKPSKGKETWIENPQDIGLYDISFIPRDCFPEVKWEDEEPRELVLKPIKKNKL